MNHAGCSGILEDSVAQVIYRRIAEALTDFENHRHEDAHRASLIVKRFLFEAFDCYIALFYLAFWDLNIMKVRAELQGMFTADCARRLALEALLPWLLQRVFAARRRGEVRSCLANHSRSQSLWVPATDL